MTDLRHAIRRSGLSNRAVCLHSSLRSFGRQKPTPMGVVDAFLEEGSTLMVPTYSWNAFRTSPSPDEPPPSQNGSAKGWIETRSASIPFTPDSTEIDEESMGAVAKAVLLRAESVRGAHPLNSFSAVGSLSQKLVSSQDAEHPNRPLAALADSGGAVVLAGVGLTSMTLIHLAEERAGRKMFVRWGLVPKGVVAARVGGCSSGFERLGRALAPYERQERVGPSLWRVFDAAGALDAATEAIQNNSEITGCDDPDCPRCPDAIAGGPEW